MKFPPLDCAQSDRSAFRHARRPTTGAGKLLAAMILMSCSALLLALAAGLLMA